MASFLRPPQKAAPRSPPTSYKSSNPSTSSPAQQGNTVGVGRRPQAPGTSALALQEKNANRTSRVEMDFESALASDGTFRLSEGVDIANFGKEEQSLEGESITGSLDTVEAERPSTANSTSRKLRKPNPSTSPSRSPHNPLTHMLSTHRGGTPTGSPRPSVSSYSTTSSAADPIPASPPDRPSTAQPSQSPHMPTSSRPRSGGGRNEEVKKRIFRSQATASSPDLGAAMKKRKGNIPKVPALPSSSPYASGSAPNARGEEDDYPSTDVGPSNLSNWTATLAARARTKSKPDLTEEGKFPKTLRERTGNFLSKVWANAGTVRERSKSAGGGDLQTAYGRGGITEVPAVPAIPKEFREESGAGGAGETIKKRQSKPLPPIVHPSGSEKSHADALEDTPKSSTSSGQRRRSVSVGDVEHWQTFLAKGQPPTSTKPSPSSTKSSKVATQTHLSPSIDTPTRPSGKRSVSSTSSNATTKASSPAISAPNTASLSSPTQVSSSSTPAPTSAEKPCHTTTNSKDWTSALSTLDSHPTSLEIKDPSATGTVRSIGNRPRSRTQDHTPPRLSIGLGVRGNSDGTIPTLGRVSSMGAPPVGFSLGMETVLDTGSTANTPTTSLATESVYATPSTGLTPTSPQLGTSSATEADKRASMISTATSGSRYSDMTIGSRAESGKEGTESLPGQDSDAPSGRDSVYITASESLYGQGEVLITKKESPSPKSLAKLRESRRTVPLGGPVIIGTTPVTIGNTVTTVRIDRSPSPHDTKPSPTTPSTLLSSSPTSNSVASPTTPTLMSTSIAIPASSSVGSASSNSSVPRRSSSSTDRSSPQLYPLPSSNPPISPRATSLRVSSLRGTTRPTLQPPHSSGSLGSPKISFTSPSQENLRNVGSLTVGRGGVKYSGKGPASASEPTLVPGLAGDERTVRLAGSGTRLRDDVQGNGSASAGRSSREGSIGTPSALGSTVNGPSSKEVGSGVGLSLEELEAKAEVIAGRIWEEDESFRARERFSEWLGGTDPLQIAARRFYMDRFDFAGLRVDHAFRRLCAKLYLRGESQVIDRILVEFSRRYWALNSGSVLGSASNVHQVVYSLLLLNTDLHVADLSSHMTKQQFVSNTMATIVAPSRASSSAATPARSSSPIQGDTDISRKSSHQEVEFSRKSSIDPVSGNITLEGAPKPGNPPISIQNSAMRMKRSGSVSSWKGTLTRETSREPMAFGPDAEGVNAYGSTVSVPETGKKHSSNTASVSSLPIVGTKNWEIDVENYLKEVYSAIKNNQILQPGGMGGGLSPGSTLSRGASQRRQGGMATLKRTSIQRIPGLLSSQQGTNGSSSSVDGRMSPCPSFSTSINDNTTASSSTLFTPALGFASNLTHTIIRESQEDDLRSVHTDASDSTTVSMSDEELALLGAPWAKEGMLTRRVQWESTGKKAKNKNWMDVFVVIQKGVLSMFTFNAHGASSKGTGSTMPGQVVGGGNWLSNATNVGEHMLAHSLSHILPPPGLPRRPHCFVLTLANGMGFFFQTGTEELANEWVSTCNYWAARQSKEPLSGGVSNMEYGWSRVEPEALAAAEEKSDSEAAHELPPRAMSSMDNTDSFSMRSGKSRRFDGFSTLRSSPFTDRIYINDWRAPGHSMIASTHDEETQLEALQKQADNLKVELKKHNDLREPMIALPKSTNLAKAVFNWEARSQYLLTESVKYDKYIESLKSAMKERLRRQGEKALERALQSSSDINEGKSREVGFSEEETIHEGQETKTEPVTPATDRVQSKQ